MSIRRKLKKKKVISQYPCTEDNYVEREQAARREKDRILVEFRFRKTRKEFVRQVGFKCRTRDDEDPMFAGRYRLLHLLGPKRFCGLTRLVLKEIETKDDLFRKLSCKALRHKFKLYIDKTFLTKDIKEMLLKRHSLRYINKYANTKEEKLEALIGTLRDNEYTFDLEKREIEQETMLEIKGEAQWTYIAGVGVSLDVLCYLFEYINPYEFERGVDHYKSKLELLNGLGMSCGTSFYYQVRRMFKRIVITKANVRKIPLITLQNARMVLIKEKGLRKADYIHIHRNICTNVSCLHLNKGKRFFAWIGNIVYKNLKKCCIPHILDMKPKEGQFPSLKDIMLIHFDTRNEVNPLSRFGKIECLRLCPYLKTKVHQNIQGIFPETLKVLKIDLRWALLDFSHECISRLMNLERLVYTNQKSYNEWNNLGVRNIWRYSKNKNIKEIQFNIIKLPDDFKSIKPHQLLNSQRILHPTSFNIIKVLREQRFEKVTVKIKIWIAELERHWFGIMKRIRKELGLKQEWVIESDERPKWAQRFELLNGLISEIPKDGYDIRCWIGKKKLAFWPKARKQPNNYYKTIVLEYTNMFINK